jgi:hypothetical protein
MEIRTNDCIRIGLKFREEMPRVELIAGASEVAPETLRNPLAVELL